jgi:4-hydroxyphenylpyruvate dioxygenase-like putative hemolysin
MFPNVLIFLAQQAPPADKGTTVNHIAFAVKDVRQMRDTARAAGYPIVTRESRRRRCRHR